MKTSLKIRLSAALTVGAVAFAWPAFAGAPTQKAATNRCDQFSGDLHYTMNTCAHFQQSAEDQNLVSECLAGVAAIKTLMLQSSCADSGMAAAH